MARPTGVSPRGGAFPARFALPTALLGLLLVAFAAPGRAAPAPAVEKEPETVRPGVVREEFPILTRPGSAASSTSRRPHRVPPPLEEVVVFEDSLDGRPLDDEGGWTHYDASGEPTAWHIDSLLHCGQGKVWWCGRVDSSWTFDSNRAGYGNAWTHYLENTVALDTIPAGTTARIGFRHHLDVEKNYDFATVEVLDLVNGWMPLATLTGKIPNNVGCDTFSVAIPESIRLQYQEDPQNPLPVPFRLAFFSDIGYSSADGLYDGDGWWVDNITVRAGAQVRFFDNGENGPGTWIATILPPVGDYFAMANNVITEDICTENRTNIWVDWDPVLQGLVPRLDNLLNTPAVHVERADRVVLNFDVYRNLPLNACFYYHLNYRYKNVGDPDWSEWVDPTRLLYYGATKDWARQKVVLPGAAGKDSVQVQLGVKDYGAIFCGGTQSSYGVYTFFDNVAIGITGNTPPILIQRDLDLFQDTFQTSAFWNNDNINTPLGDSTVVQLNVAGGYKNGFLHYRLNGGSFAAVPLAVSSPALNTFRYGDLPAGNYPANTKVEYYFSVTDSQDVSATLPIDAVDAQNYFSMSVLPMKTAVNPALACFDSLAPILFVNNFVNREPRPYMADAMTALGYKFDTWNVLGPTSLIGNTPAGSTPGGLYYWPPTSVNSLTQYKAILWHSGNLSALPIRKEDQAMLQSWIQQPGKDRNFWISGDDVANALFTGDDYNAFLQFTCGARLIRDLWENFPQDTLVPIVKGVPGSPTANRFMHANAGCPLIDDFDMIASSFHAIITGKAGPYLTYPNTQAAATRFATKYTAFGTDSARVVFQGFSFNNIQEGGERIQLMQQTLQNYFGIQPCYYASGVDEEDGAGAPRIPNRLFQNAPNPFNPETTIRYSVSAAGPVTIRIFNAGGALVRTLVDEARAAGEHTARWNATDDSGRRLGSGVYFYEIQSAGGFRAARKLVLLK
ncbi:MAG TPA: FlgD immunoglobulin-like domain containing protein [Candidatus Eisenbacteria bacterium]|nr:FlgD immunoglobulin-like domain containing protein [Candidatus Eisenbacteria bacterium]